VSVDLLYTDAPAQLAVAHTPLEVAFVGSVVPPGMAEGSRAFSPAGNKFQLNLIRNLQSRAGAHVQAFSMRPLAAYPGDDVLAFGGRRTELAEVPTTLLPFVNVRGIKESGLAAAFYAHLRRWAASVEAGPRALLVYNVFSALSAPVLAAARAWNIPAVAVVADLPFDVYRFRGARGLLERAELRAQLAALRRFDGLVVLTPHTAHDHAPGVPWMLMEGALPAAEAGALSGRAAPLTPGRAPGERVVMYSGMLNEMNGIPLLLDAFDRLREPHWRLWVYGGGPLDGAVQAAARHDPRITFHPWGVVPEAEVLRRQRQAHVLVNPRPSSHRANRYSFPSKLLEYLASGTPVVSTAPPGVPAEYHPHLLLPAEESAEGMAAAIRRAAGLSDAERDARAARARAWLLREKTWERQAERIGDFMRSLARPLRAGGTG
jgi:glycosyltransferase involved in cell wall biosynthesis